MKYFLVCAVLLIFPAYFPYPLAADEPAHIITFSGKQNAANADYYLEINAASWISNHELLADGWYFNRNTNRFIPPYLFRYFMEISPYDGKTGVFADETHVYLGDIDSYMNGIAPRAIPVPPELPRVNVGTWISADEILFLAAIHDEAWRYDMESYRYLVFSPSNQTWKEIEAGGFKYFGSIRSMRGAAHNRIVTGEHQPEIPFLVWRINQYLPETGGFTSDGREYSEMGDRGGVSPFGIEYDVNLLEDGQVYYSGLIGRTCLIMLANIREFINSVVLPELPKGRRYSGSRLSPNGISLLTSARNTRSYDKPFDTAGAPEFLVFDERVPHSYRWRINIKEEFGIREARYIFPLDIETLISLLFGVNEKIQSSETRERMRDWLIFLNDGAISRQSDRWIIPKRGSFLYMIGMGEETFRVEVETIGIKPSK
jgi:hypothetical protein